MSAFVEEHRERFGVEPICSTLGLVASLQALVAIAVHRDAVQAEAVETAALRRSDELCR